MKKEILKFRKLCKDVQQYILFLIPSSKIFKIRLVSKDIKRLFTQTFIKNYIKLHFCASEKLIKINKLVGNNDQNWLRELIIFSNKQELIKTIEKCLMRNRNYETIFYFGGFIRKYFKFENKTKDWKNESFFFRIIDCFYDLIIIKKKKIDETTILFQIMIDYVKKMILKIKNENVCGYEGYLLVIKADFYSFKMNNIKNNQKEELKIKIIKKYKKIKKIYLKEDMFEHFAIDILIKYISYLFFIEKKEEKSFLLIDCFEQDSFDFSDVLSQKFDYFSEIKNERLCLFKEFLDYLEEIKGTNASNFTSTFINKFKNYTRLFFI